MTTCSSVGFGAEMRGHGVVSSAAGLVPFGHVGCGYSDRDEFCERVAEYVADGLTANQRIEYVGDASREALTAELATIGFGDGVKSGRIRVTPAEEFYEFQPDSDIVDGEATVAERVAATEQAVADGYSGLRAVVDGTAFARSAEQRNACATFEYLVDQMMAVLPSSSLCAYDLNSLGPAAVELTCLHPFVTADAASFQLFAEPGFGFALVGEIDAADHDVFITTLRRAWKLQASGPVVIDARGLDFVTHHELSTLDNYARAEHREVVLCTDQRVVARLTGILPLTNVRVAPGSPELAPAQS